MSAVCAESAKSFLADSGQNGQNAAAILARSAGARCSAVARAAWIDL